LILVSGYNVIEKRHDSHKRKIDTLAMKGAI
jgi:hypothetical protein